MTSLVASASFNYEILGAFAECDLVAVVGKYSQTGVIVDMFRIKENKIIEHWDSDSNQAARDFISINDSGDHNGPLKLELINELYTLGLFTNSSDIINTYFDARARVYRSGESSYSAFSRLLSTSKIRYSKIHHTIADSKENTVFVLAEGTLDGKPYAFYDFYRLLSTKIDEHWDSRRAVPTSTASGLPIF